MPGKARWGQFVPSWDLVDMGVDKEHLMVYRSGGRTIFGRWYEDWRCRGCGIRFYVKGRSVKKVGALTHKLQIEHSHYMSWTAVFTQLAEFKWAAKAVKIKFKADLTQSVYGDRSEAHGTAR